MLNAAVTFKVYAKTQIYNIALFILHLYSLYNLQYCLLLSECINEDEVVPVHHVHCVALTNTDLQSFLRLDGTTECTKSPLFVVNCLVYLLNVKGK